MHIDTSWIKANWRWCKVKPALRSALAAWIAMVLFVIPTVQKWLGQASFLILIASVLSPPAEPFVVVFEREMIICSFVAASWAWSCLGIFAANQARRTIIPPSEMTVTPYDGHYIETAPTIILGIFLVFGTCVLLFFRARQGPGPYMFATLLGCICMDISLTTAHLFPYPFYDIGKAIMIPITLHTAIALLASVLFFPSSVSASFMTRLGDVVHSARENMKNQIILLEMVGAGVDWYTKDDQKDSTPQYRPIGDVGPPDTFGSLGYPATENGHAEGAQHPVRDQEETKAANSQWSTTTENAGEKHRPANEKTSTPSFDDALLKLRTGVKASEALLVPLAAAGRLMKSDLVFGRVNPLDFKDLQATARKLAVRSDGMTLYWDIIERERDGVFGEHMPVTPVTSRLGSRSATPLRGRSRLHTPATSREHSPEHSARDFTHGSPDTVPPSPSSPLSPSHMLHHRKRRTRSNIPQHVRLADDLDLHRQATSNQHHTHAQSNQQDHHQQRNFHHTLTSRLSNLSHSLSSLQLHIPHRSQEQAPVGVFESIRYLLAEPDLFPKYDETSAFTPPAMAKLLSSTSLEVVRECEKAMAVGERWVREGGRKGRWAEALAMIGIRRGKASGEKGRQEEELMGLRETRERLRGVLEGFQSDGRHRVLDPYRPVLEADSPGPMMEGEVIPPHRYLFHCYVYQSHLIRYCQLVLQLLDEIIHIADTRRTNHLWTPVERLFRWNDTWRAPENLDKEDDENPEHIPGIQSSWDDLKSELDLNKLDLGLARRRNPDFLPAHNAFEWLMDWVYRGVAGLGGGNVLYAIKAGVLEAILLVPILLKRTAGFAYAHKFVWGLIMAQLTLARFRGDTVFGFTARVISTFLGGIVGLLIWYIGSGAGTGNPFGLAAVTFVCFPFFFYARLYWPGPPMTNVIFFVTISLVVGYSYQDEYQLTASSPGVGVAVAWKRFVLVTAGVTAAGIFSFLPPSTTIRVYQRITLSTTISELGAVYCSVVSFANSRVSSASSSSRKEYNMTEIIRTLTAIRAKLNRSLFLKTNAVYEFSLRGRWPAKRYHRVLELQMELAYALSHLLTTIERLEPAWTRAYLVRSHLSDPDLQGDVLAVISMITTALRTGTALPQITPCPLISRIGQKSYGLNIIQNHAEDDFGLPRTLTKETLENEQYMMLCVATSTTFRVIAALDKLMIATKEIVGEHYHIHGLGLASMYNADSNLRRSGLGVPLGSRTNSWTVGGV